MSSNRSSQLLKRTGGVLALGGSATLALSLFTSPVAVAGGNPNFNGILSASTPTGFLVSPQAYDISQGPVTVDFNVPTRNRTNSKQTVALNFSADHILTYKGQDVSDGQPGQPGITFTGPDGTTQQLIPGSQSFTKTWAPNQRQTLALTYVFDACGYYQLDVWGPEKPSGENDRTRETLASGFIRVLGCAAQTTPTPTPPTPTGTVSGTTTTPSPTSSVNAINTPGPPSAGASPSDAVLGVASGLLIIGCGLLVAGTRRARVDI